MPQKPRILVADEDPIVAESLEDFLELEGYVTSMASNGEQAMTLLNTSAAHGCDVTGSEETAPFGLVVADVNMPRCDGMELLRRVRKQHPSVAVIMITGYGKIETAVESLKLGAVDYLTKPVIDDELRVAVGKALQQHTLLSENQSLRSQLERKFGLANLVGVDQKMQRVYELVESVAPSRTTVVIQGQSGTGKSMIARAIHALSERSAGPFVTFSCGSIPESLLESELFGHVRGAFTGADADKPGRILAADGGTLFIDEINSATPALQLKLLRVLQEKQFEPVGSNKTVNVDVRFVLATNQSLKERVREGLFREDLYYRINVVNIKMPALRERTGDIPLLAAHFLEKFAQETGRLRHLTDEALSLMTRYDWPGNVRELENAIERAVVLSRQPGIQPQDLPDALREPEAVHTGVASSGLEGERGVGAVVVPALCGGWTPTPLIDAMREPERQILLAALEANNWNRQKTARQLEINRTTLYKKIKQYGLDQSR